MTAPILLDTCAALWLMGKEPMSPESLAALRTARAANSGIYVCTFTAWEIGTLVAKGRIQLTLTPEVWFESLLAIPGIRLSALSPAVLLASTSLPGTPPSDPADRIVAATARTFGYTVLTRDQKLLAYAQHGHMSALAC
jgi:PIN domain nuclease of toxin-antitoxin system